jgi:hypothetical protein
VDYRSQSWVIVDVEDVVRCPHYRSVVVVLWQRRDGGMRSNWYKLYGAHVERSVRKLRRLEL